MFDAVLENDLNSESPIGKSVSDSFREIAQKNNIGLVYTKIISFEEMLNLPFLHENKLCKVRKFFVKWSIQPVNKRGKTRFHSSLNKELQGRVT